MANESTDGIDLANVDRVMRTTRSVRLRLDLEKSVPDALIEEAIDVALQGTDRRELTNLAVHGRK